MAQHLLLPLPAAIQRKRTPETAGAVRQLPRQTLFADSHGQLPESAHQAAQEPETRIEEYDWWVGEQGYELSDGKCQWL